MSSDSEGLDSELDYSSGNESIHSDDVVAAMRGAEGGEADAADGAESPGIYTAEDSQGGENSKGKAKRTTLEIAAIAKKRKEKKERHDHRNDLRAQKAAEK